MHPLRSLQTSLPPLPLLPNDIAIPIDLSPVRFPMKPDGSIYALITYSHYLLRFLCLLPLASCTPLRIRNITSGIAEEQRYSHTIVEPTSQAPWLIRHPTEQASTTITP